MKECVDHLGNKYRSKSDMCRHWNISLSAFKSRINNSWSLEKALTTPSTSTQDKCHDHLGNVFESMTQMCDYWEIAFSVYTSRMRRGWSQKDSLTTPVDDIMKRQTFDHLGQRFKSKAAMCKYWGINVETYRSRIKSGWSVQEALTGKLNIPYNKLGNEIIAICGLKMRITDIDEVKYITKRGRRRTAFTVEFEDGAIVNNVIYDKFIKGDVGHPTLNYRKGMKLGYIKAKRIERIDDTVYYECTCKKCEYKGILTPQQMIEHNKTHEQK